MTIATTPIEKPMLELLSAKLLGEYGDDPLALAGCVVLLPNRRSCMTLQRYIQNNTTSNNPSFVPNIRPIGDVDDAMLWAAGLLGDDAVEKALQALPALASAPKRLIALAQELYAHRELWPVEMVTMDDAMSMASQLVGLIDELDRAMVEYDRVEAIHTGYVAEHRYLSLRMLKHVLRWAQKWEKEQQAVSLVKRRNQMMLLLADYWEENPPNVPVVAAGSTGSQPATARLLQVISALPKGMVIIPAVDVVAAEDEWEAIGPTHPQYHVKALLDALHCPRAEVVLLEDEAIHGELYAKARGLLEAATPAPYSFRWAGQAADHKAALKAHCHRIDCASEWEEARVIALLLRETLQEPDKRVALITHDANLVERVSALMQQYDVKIDNTTAQTMLDHPAIHYGLLWLHAATHHDEPIALLAALKHGYSSVATQVEWLHQLERACLRGVRRKRDHVSTLRVAADHKDVNDAAAHAFNALADRLEPLYKLCQRAVLDVAALNETMLSLIESVEAVDDDIVRKLSALFKECEGLKHVAPEHYFSLLKTCLSTQRWFPERSAHPRCVALSPIEARLQPFDRVVLGGMNEGSWPQLPAPDAWLSSAMRAEIAVPSEQESIGQQAQDFLTIAASTECFMTRADHAQGAEGVPSRFLERLDAYSGHILAENDLPYVAWVQEMQQATPMDSLPFPAPNPPLDVRPTSLSVTEIETWLRDPYAIYAKHVLALKVLDAIDEPMNAATLGQLLHALLESFVKAVNGNKSLLCVATLEELLQKELRHYEDQPQVRAIWAPRIAQLFDWIVEIEESRRAEGRTVEAEQKYQTTIEHKGKTLTIRAKMDRIEHGAEGATIIDYKTGKAPTDNDIAQGIAPQLPLEAIILSEKADGLEFWEIGSGHKTPTIRKLKGEIEDITAIYEEGMKQLIERYLIEKLPYYVSPHIEYEPRYNDYALLERKQEWAG